MIFNVLRDSQIDSLIESNVDCTGCSGKCCQVYEIIEITSKEAQSLEHDISIYDGRFFLKRKDDKCFYQADNGLCTIHDRRPKVCRSYDCRKDFKTIPESKYQ